MKWGIYEDPPYRHVAPCDEHGQLQKGHQLDDKCSCQPYRDETDPKIIVHEVIQ